MGMYANSTARTLERMGSGRSRIFHYRSGFGGAAVRVAKRFGMIAVCDHSIVHPAFLSGLVRAGGKFDPQSKDDAYHPYWGRVVADCEAADAILVNSEFVRSTFLAKGFEPSRVHTIYLGVDDSFLEDVPEVVRQVTAGAPLRLMFGASLCDRRKGTHHLLEACRRLRGLPWELKIAGAIPDDMRREFRDVLESPAVRMLGLLSRKELAREMTDTDVFVCPSLAEGSARVIFEAMACGCHIITTPNSGSIVESDVHGQLIVPGDPESIVAAIRRALDSREWVGEVGARNSALVRGSYLQTHYGAAVLDLYEKLLRERMAGSR
jgi:glycosyltransferase involved in cell wall biosynthesis